MRDWTDQDGTPLIRSYDPRLWARARGRRVAVRLHDWFWRLAWIALIVGAAAGLGVQS